MAAVLAFFTGAVGGHKVYLRQGGIAIFMVFALVVSWGALFPFFFMFGLFDAIRLMSMSDQQFDRRYNRYSSSNRRDDYLANRQHKRDNKKLPSQTNRRQSSRASAAKANPFKNSGLRKYKDFDLEGAIDDFSKGIDINPTDMALHFNIACAYSLTEQKDKAYHHLAKAVELGYKDFENIDTKDDLAFVRIQPEFENFKENGYRLTGNMRRPGNSASSTSSKKKIDPNEPLPDVLLSQLNKLAELRKKGLLSTEEYNTERQKLFKR